MPDPTDTLLEAIVTARESGLSLPEVLALAADVYAAWEFHEPAGTPTQGYRWRWYGQPNGRTAKRLRKVVAQLGGSDLTIAVDTETIIDPGSPQPVDPLRSTLVSISIAISPGEAYYFPFRHRLPRAAQGELLIDAAGVPLVCEKLMLLSTKL